MCQTPDMRSLCWPGHRDDRASPQAGGIPMSPRLGQKLLGQGISQAERAISFQNAMRDGVPVAGVHTTTIRPVTVEGEEKNAGLHPRISWVEMRDFSHVSC
jgi:hypothetical protein